MAKYKTAVHKAFIRNLCKVTAVYIDKGEAMNKKGEEGEEKRERED
jgi:hypothetical protein